MHAVAEASQADRMAKRIVQFGSVADFSPNRLTRCSHADRDESTDLRSMLRANPIAERIAVQAHRQMIRIIGDKDPTTLRMLENALSDEEEHAQASSDWLDA